LLRRHIDLAEPDGKLMVHIFCHARLHTHFEPLAIQTGWEAGFSPGDHAAATSFYIFSAILSWKNNGAFRNSLCPDSGNVASKLRCAAEGIAADI